MKLISKVLSLIIATAIILSCFASCDLLSGKPESAISDAEAALDGATYVATTELAFTSDDEDMKSTVASLGDTSVKVSVNGESVAVTTRLSTTNTTLEVDCTVHDGVVYRRDYLKVGEKDATTLKKSPITDNEKKNMASSAAPGSDITYEDFSDVKMESSGNVKLITCTVMKEESLESIKAILSERLGIATTDVSVSDAEYVVKIVDGKYEGIYLSCYYSFVIDGVSYDLRLQAVTSYDYSADVTISLPANASEYELASLDEVVNL